MTIFRYNSLSVGAGLLLVAGCNQPTQMPADGMRELETFGPSQPPTDEGEPFHVASDSQANYRLLSLSKRKNGNLEVVTRRDGSSGTSFTRTEINCNDMRYKVLGEGDTKEQALGRSEIPGDWTDLVEGSIKDVTVKLACSKGGA